MLRVVNRLLENKNFAAMTNMIAHYLMIPLLPDMPHRIRCMPLSALLMGETKRHPE